MTKKFIVLHGVAIKELPDTVIQHLVTAMTSMIEARVKSWIDITSGVWTTGGFELSVQNLLELNINQIDLLLIGRRSMNELNSNVFASMGLESEIVLAEDSSPNDLYVWVKETNV